MTYENILFESEGGIAKITLNRPKAYNALCRAINLELEDALAKIKADPAVRVLILSGGMKCFAAGADIVEMMNAGPLEADKTAELAHSINNTLESLPIPVIASVCGMALGGGLELTLSCDFRVVAEDAKLGLPEVGLGILPGAGGSQRLSRYIGPARAKEVVMLGRNITGKEALEYGLATKAVPADQVEAETAKLAQRLMKKPAAGLMLAKSAINFGDTYGPGAGKLMEKALFAVAFSTADQKEGMKAFTEKREPEYKHVR
jgi:enoyl-CoA hydratase/carnithine racemase